MNLDEAKRYLGDRWLLSPNYRPQAQHSPYHAVDVSRTIRRATMQQVVSDTVATNILRLSRQRAASAG